MPATLTTLVPRLPPAIDGVGDYAARVAAGLAQRHGIATHFVVGDPAWSGEPATGTAIAQRSAAAVAQHLPTDGNASVLLHYVPHGYAAKACPSWLVQALEQWHHTTPQAQLITMFHELYAFDWQRPWSSDFWLSPRQRHLAARLAQLSDRCLTSSDRYAHQLRHLSRGKHPQVRSLPVFSNVGEPTSVAPWGQRQPQLVIFGQRHSKGRIYGESLSLLEAACQILGIEGIWDIGPTLEHTPATVGGVPIEPLGPLPTDAIGAYLSRARAGFLAYDPQRLSKSGIFAAYCAHGLLPINHRRQDRPGDGLTAGIQYWVPGPAADFAAIAAQAHAWYQTHTLTHQVDTLAQLLPGCSTHDPHAIRL